MKPSISAHSFSESLFRIMPQINPGIQNLELYEFQYGLDNLMPAGGWGDLPLAGTDVLERLISRRDFYEGIQLSPMREGKIVVDNRITELTQMLFSGLVSGAYPPSWVKRLFYFDLRSFLFFVRTQYFTREVIEHFGGKPWMQFSPAQRKFAGDFDISYKAFREANREIDGALAAVILRLATGRGKVTVLTLAGPSGAGKTEIVARLRAALDRAGLSSTTVEMDHFNQDREYRDRTKRHQDSIHFELFQEAMQRILQGKKAISPNYDFYKAVSSHDPDGSLRPGAFPREIEPADVVFLEGNFPFHIPEIAPLIGIKIVYLTDDPIRLKRKWKRDIDYRKKYDPNYFCNRYFRTQFPRAEEIYRPLLAVSDLAVDTTTACLWAAPAMTKRIGSVPEKFVDLDDGME